MRLERRHVLVSTVLLVLVLVTAVWAVTLGSSAIDARDVLAVLAGREDGMERTVVLEWRMPRIAAAVLFGALLGVSGALFQSLTRNPLGSPDIIGFNSGAFTGVVAVLLLGASSFTMLTLGALAGGTLAAAVVYALSFRRGISGFRFIITGIAIGAFLSSVNTWFSVKADVDIALRAAVWGAGTLGLVDWSMLALAGGVTLAVLAVLPIAQRWLRHLELGDATATTLGVPTEAAKAVLIALGIVTTAIVTAACGPIAFVSLVAPHIARRLTGRGGSVDLVGSALVGALLLLVSDVAAQHALGRVILPVGAVTVSIGGLYLVWLLVVESRKE